MTGNSDEKCFAVLNVKLKVKLLLTLKPVIYCFHVEHY